MTKRIIALVLALMMTAAVVAGCSGSTSTATADEANATDTAKTYNIGICQLVQHVALDAATQGFKDYLTEQLGDAVTFNEQNAQGDSATCTTIANQFVADNVDLILGNATPALQAAFTATADIPVLGTSITDYGTALDIADWTGVSGFNVSGTSDLAPLDGQAEILNELFPDAKTVGLLYCSAEPNSKYQCDTISGYLEGYGYELKTYTFSDSNDIAAVVTSACEEVDVIYIPTDNSAASNTGIIDNIALEKKIPIITGEEGICSGCGVATLSIDYYDLGYTTGKMAYDILVNGADVSAMEVQFAAATTKKYDAARAAAFDLEIPEDYVAIETE